MGDAYIIEVFDKGAASGALELTTEVGFADSASLGKMRKCDMIGIVFVDKFYGRQDMGEEAAVRSDIGIGKNMFPVQAAENQTDPPSKTEVIRGALCALFQTGLNDVTVNITVRPVGFKDKERNIATIVKEACEMAQRFTGVREISEIFRAELQDYGFLFRKATDGSVGDA